MTATAIPQAAVRRRPWVVLWVVFLASVAAAMAQFPVPPLMPVLMGAFGVDVVAAGALMSVFSITGAILALPTAVILRRYGARATGVVALLAVVAGSVLGAVTGDFTVLLVSRAVQGIGMGLIAVVAPSVIADVFEPSARGLPMGIWATWPPVAGVVMFNLAAPMADAFGWRSVWWFNAGVAGIAAVLYAAVVRGGSRHDGAAGREPGPSPWLALRSGRLWLLGAGFAAFCVSLAALNTFLPTYLVEVHGAGLAAAASTTSLVLVAFVVGSPLAGVVSDRLGSRRVVSAAALLGMAALWLLPFAVDASLVPVVLVAFGVLAGAVPPTTFASAPELVPDLRLVPMAIGVVMRGQNVGNIVGPSAFAATLDAQGWATAAIAMAVVTAAGAIGVWFARGR